MIPTIVLLVELVVLFVGVSFLLEILQRRYGPERLRRWMGGRPVVAALKGVVVGFVTPFCTHSAIPLLVGMRRAGVPPAGYVAFISAAPVLDPILFGALWLIVGPTVAVIYFVVTFIAALLLALTSQYVGIERHLKAADEEVPTRRPVAVGAPNPVVGDGDFDGCSTADERWWGWRVESRLAPCCAHSGRCSSWASRSAS